MLVYVLTNRKPTIHDSIFGENAQVCNAWCMFGLFPDGYTEEDAWQFMFWGNILLAIPTVGI